VLAKVRDELLNKGGDKHCNLCYSKGDLTEYKTMPGWYICKDCCEDGE